MMGLIAVPGDNLCIWVSCPATINEEQGESHSRSVLLLGVEHSELGRQRPGGVGDDRVPDVIAVDSSRRGDILGPCDVVCNGVTGRTAVGVLAWERTTQKYGDCEEAGGGEPTSSPPQLCSSVS